MVGCSTGVVSAGFAHLPVNHHLKLLLKTMLLEIMSLVQMLMVDIKKLLCCPVATHISGFGGKIGNVSGWQIASLV
jgi:hypothetical protein